jgi:hypothetical protein
MGARLSTATTAHNPAVGLQYVLMLPDDGSGRVMERSSSGGSPSGDKRGLLTAVDAVGTLAVSGKGRAAGAASKWTLPHLLWDENAEQCASTTDL